MGKWQLEITLKSDLCVSSGEGDPGLISTRCALDQGIPYIPAKRIKGSLRDVARELCDSGVITIDAVQKLFGARGMYIGQGARFFDARLQLDPGDCSELTRERSRTAIDKTLGTAAAGSLRNLQVVPKGKIFCGEIEGVEDAETLEMCVKGLRHLGLGIHRGLGEVVCRLLPAQEEQTVQPETGGLPALDKYGINTEIELKYELELQEPLLLFSQKMDESTDCISGNALAGAFAGMFIREYGLGEHAHQDEVFKRIFLREGVRFGYGFFIHGQEVFYPVPNCLVQAKDNDHEVLNHYLKPEERVKALNVQAALDKLKINQQQILTCTVKKGSSLHHSRPDDRSIGHALNDLVPREGNFGQLYQYHYIAKGQVFAGTIKGSKEDMEKLLICLGKNQSRIRLGKSKTAEYGQCVMRLSEIPVIKTGKAQKEWIVCLVTPAIIFDETICEFESSTENLKKQVCAGIPTEYGARCCKWRLKYTIIKGYNGKWRLPARQYRALAAGSCWRMKFDQPISAEMLETLRIGAFSGKGYGQIKVIPADLSRLSYIDLRKGGAV